MSRAAGTPTNRTGDAPAARTAGTPTSRTGGTPMTRLSARGLTLAYEERTVVHDLDLDVPTARSR